MKREIILLSDFRKQDWLDWDSAAVDAFRERLSSTPNSPELTWVDFGKEASEKFIRRESCGFFQDRWSRAPNPDSSYHS